MMRVVVGSAPQKEHHKTPTPREELHWKNIDLDDLATRASTASLLGDTEALVFVGALSGERSEEFLALAPGLVASPHTFIFEEEKLLKRPLELLAKAKAEVVVYASLEKKESFDVFSLANAFGARDRKKMWLLLTQGLVSGMVPEAALGMLHWKVRDLLGKKSPSYTPGELRNISRELVTLYHEAHRGGGDLELLLERFLLLI